MKQWGAAALSLTACLDGIRFGVPMSASMLALGVVFVISPACFGGFFNITGFTPVNSNTIASLLRLAGILGVNSNSFGVLARLGYI
ncbi:hypothetical protein [Paenibacillus sp. LHD-38]|uniref:hypothetical protein n=1 Tax=Paenibacillus sp. LHD-38 TaxID=3072143 RepID=UPI00280D0D1E|nr:hypothetical protein [Paenibacillus sp. LHD-38]MDQ8733893.1 hypothetical protein [Paenibacillus sp. LHD-38]